MDAGLKEKWVKALRSGRYKQTQRTFEHEGKFCCLGVLCKVARQPTKPDEGGNWPFTDVALGGYRHSSSLALMNDQGSSFREIADYIEKHF